MMKTEKIEKHMRKRTVVRGQDARSTVFGVIAENSDGCPPPLRVEGHYGHDWFHTHEVRKATDDERAAFFAWLVSDGSDIDNGFARFGGAPRGFEEWRTAQEKPVEATPAPDVPAVGWMFTPPKPAFTVGQRVRLESGGGQPPLLGFTNGGVYTVRKVAPNGSSVELELEPGETGFAAVNQIEPAPVEPPAPKHKRGDLRVWLRNNGTAGVARVTSVDDDVWTDEDYHKSDEVYEPTRANVAALVAQQREHGIKPELGDLVYVMGRATGGMLGGRLAFVSSGVGAAMTLACAGTTAQVTAHPNLLILVIRRNPLRELGDE